MARGLPLAVFFAVSTFSVVARRLEQRKSMSKTMSKSNDAVPNVVLDNLQLGEDPYGPLVPSLVPMPGQTFEVRNREAFDFIESNEYHWNMVSISNISSASSLYGRSGAGSVVYPDKWFAKLDGGFFSNIFGWKTTVVKNNNGTPLFKIHLAKHIWNPLRWSWSFRIVHPRTGKVLFTINKDWYGAGFLWGRDEWRIYRGHKRAGQEIYYIVSGYVGYSHYFYHSKADWSNHKQPVAEASQSIARDVIGLPDAFTLKVKEGEDTALLMATTVILDMVYEVEEAEEREQARRERKRRKNGKNGQSLMESNNKERAGKRR